MLHERQFTKAACMTGTVSMAILAFVTAIRLGPVRADQSEIESTRLQVVQVANELLANPLHDSDYGHIADDVDSLKANVAGLRPQTNQAAVVEKLKTDVQELSDTMNLWAYGREHNPFPQKQDDFSLAHLPSSDPMYGNLNAKYGDDDSFKIALAGDSPYILGLMMSLASSAKFDAIYLVNKMTAAESQGNSSLKVNFPFTTADAVAAIQVGSRTNEEALLGREMEWHIDADRNNETGSFPFATVETPFFKAARLAAKRKAKYESAPPPALLAKTPEMKVLTVDMYLQSKFLGAFDDSACIIKQGDLIIHATNRSVSHPSVTDDAFYAYDVVCDFPMTKYNPSAPYQVKLANVTLLDVDNAQVSRGDVNFNVNPLKMR